MHLPILWRYIINILYNVMIRLINYKRFSTNDNEYLKLDDGMRKAILEVSNYFTLSFFQAKCNPPSVPWCGCQMFRGVHSIVKLNTTCDLKNNKRHFLYKTSPKWVKILSNFSMSIYTWYLLHSKKW